MGSFNFTVMFPEFGRRSKIYTSGIFLGLLVGLGVLTYHQGADEGASELNCGPYELPLTYEKLGIDVDDISSITFVPEINPNLSAYFSRECWFLGSH